MSEYKTVNYDGMFTLIAPSPKWVWDKNGVLTEVPAGQPAYEWDPITGEFLGQKIEPTPATNYYENTADLSATIAGDPRYSATAVNSIFASGVVSNLITRDDVGVAPMGYGTPRVSNGGLMTAWAIVEQESTDVIRIGIRDQDMANFAGLVSYRFSTDELQAAQPDNKSGTTAPVYRKEILSESGPNGGRVILISCTADVQSGNNALLLFYTDNTDTIGAGSIPHFIQFEDGTVITSPIITGSSSRIRSGDDVRMSGIDQKAWYAGATEGVFLIEFSGLERASPALQTWILTGDSTCRWFYTSAGDAPTMYCYDGAVAASSGRDPHTSGAFRAATRWNAETMWIAGTGNNVIHSASHNGNLSNSLLARLFSNNVAKVHLSDLYFRRALLSDEKILEWVNAI